MVALIIDINMLNVLTRYSLLFPRLGTCPGKMVHRTLLPQSDEGLFGSSVDQTRLEGPLGLQVRKEIFLELGT